MTDSSRSTSEPETPVNPYSLLEAVNRSADTVRKGWLVYLALLAYLAIAVAGVTHLDLLLAAPVKLPLLSTNIPLVTFFILAPAVLVGVHAVFLGHLAPVARSSLELHNAIQLLEVSDRRLHPLRLEINGFLLAQAVAGPRRGAILALLSRTAIWIAVVALPVLLLLFVQVSFLPFHDATVTWVHRVLLLVDVLVVALVGVFLSSTAGSLWRALIESVRDHPFSHVATGLFLVGACAFSFLVATIPGEPLDAVGEMLLDGAGADAEGSDAESGALAAVVNGMRGARQGGARPSLFNRNLRVMDQDVSHGAAAARGAGVVSLRGRDLRLAVLDGSRLRGADLSGADLSGASLVEADLSGARLSCPVTGGDGVAGARPSCASLKRADLTRAKLDGALLSGGVDARGATMREASLMGADLAGASLALADLTRVALQGARLDDAGLEGAVLRDANLEAATLMRARLFGTDLSGARLSATDLSGSLVWGSEPPVRESAGLSDLNGVEVAPPGDRARGRLAEYLETSEPAAERKAAEARLAPLLDGAKSADWQYSEAKRGWDTLIVPVPYSPDVDPRQRLTEALVREMCRGGQSEGSALAVGIARRASEATFKGDAIAIYDMLASSSCAGARDVGLQALRDLAASVAGRRTN